MSKPDTWKSWEGRQIDGKFTLRQWLGGSDHSAVFLTEVPGTPPQKAAIKLIPCETGEDAETQLRSLQAKTGLSHRNLLQTFEAGRTQVDGECVIYAVTECADDNLGQILPQRTLEPAEVAELLPPLLSALSYLHEKGLVHGRVRPSNILAAGDQLKLSTDRVQSNSEQKPSGRQDEYDAPETSLRMLSPSSDIWSLGMTLVAAFTQKPAPQKPQSDPIVPSSVPEPYRGIAQASLRLDHEKRCSIREIERRLKTPTRAAEAAVAVAPPEPVTSQPATPKKRTVFPVTIALAAVLVIIFAIFYFGRSKSSTPLPETSQPPATTVQGPTPQTSAPTSGAQKQNDPAGSVTHQVLPDVPQSAKNTITGTIKVVVQTQVDASGKVTSAKLKSAGSSRYFAGLALKAAPKWEFSAPVVDGQPTASTWLLQFRFRRSGTQASAQRSKH
ncbi:MAG TPA: TonB family protein [Candidatus Eisenbacteria bacterium]|nr:TonB family protein [Candidatus Eisenbacteria bacterium]